MEDTKKKLINLQKLILSDAKTRKEKDICYDSKSFEKIKGKEIKLFLPLSVLEAMEKEVNEYEDGDSNSKSIKQTNKQAKLTLVTIDELKESLVNNGYQTYEKDHDLYIIKDESTIEGPDELNKDNTNIVCKINKFERKEIDLNYAGFDELTYKDRQIMFDMVDDFLLTPVNKRGLTREEDLMVIDYLKEKKKEFEDEINSYKKENQN